MSLRTLVALLALSSVAHAGWLKPDVDFSNYDTPVYQQIVNRIKAGIGERLGEGTNSRDRYFMVPFAYENDGNDPEFSHSFISVVRVFADHKQPRRTRGLKVGKYKDREFEAFTISWIPHDFAQNPDLCVFNGTGSRLFASRNTCPISVGRIFTLEETIKLGADVKNAICMWGPYEVTKEAFDLGVKRVRLLQTGKIKYRADDRLYRMNKENQAINCFHAIASIDEPFPNGGIFGTGFKMWGINGTTRVLLEYTKRASNRDMLLDKVDVKKDRYCFVYAPSPKHSLGIYNPGRNSAAYRR